MGHASSPPAYSGSLYLPAISAKEGSGPHRRSTSTLRSPRLLLGAGDEREPRPLLDGGELVGPADRVELEAELGQGVELVLAVGDEVIGPAEAPDRLRRAGDDLPALPAGVPRRRGDPPAIRQPRVDVVPGAFARVCGPSHRERIDPGRSRRPGATAPSTPPVCRRASTSPGPQRDSPGWGVWKPTADRGCTDQNASPSTRVTDRAWIRPPVSGDRGSSARPTLPPAVGNTSPVRYLPSPASAKGEAEE